MVLTELPPPPGRHRRPKRGRGAALAIVAALLAILVFPSVSYVKALTYPGQATFLERSVEWVRDNGGGGLVNVLENWWYSRPPSAAAPASGSVPTAPVQPGAAAPPALPVLAGAAPLAGEGRWTAAVPAPGGGTAIYTTFVRPDEQHAGIVAGVALMKQHLLRFGAVAGTQQPVQDPTQAGAVPAAALPALAATFNSGFKMVDAQGGYQAGGQVLVPLRVGAASLVIRTDGTATVGQWTDQGGRDVGPGLGIAAVRQNLDLVVDNGALVPGLAADASGRWSTSKNQLQYTWRSGVGVDAAGDLVYVGGDNLTLVGLATALQRAGVVTGMELDIHTNKVDFFSYRHAAGSAPLPTRLLPDMTGPSDRYLRQDARDFFYATLR
jgi:hypothetical protein